MQTISPSQASAEVPINENFQTLIHQEVYGKKQSTTTGLTWGYWGGRWAGFLIADGTLALTASATNYIVVLRSTGAISVSTAATNWNDANNYQRVYRLTTNATAVTATEDHRAGQGGVHGGQGIASSDEFVNAQTGTAYTYLTADKGKLVTHSNAGAIAGTLPQAGASFPAGWWMDVQNTGAGTLTITPTTSTLDGAASLALSTGQGVRLVSNGVNYFTQRGVGGGGGGALPPKGHLHKSDKSTVAFTKTGVGTATIKAGTEILVASTLVSFAADTAIVMPVLTAGTDYAIYACTDGTVRADANFSAPSGYTAANSRKIGGFHYSPGGHSGVSGGGNATAQINEYSLWDLKFKPACLDPRGMALVADGFWADIYLLGVDHLTNGSSKYNVTIADGASPPKIPTKFGGDGTVAYTSLNWWEAGEVMAHHGKRLPTYTEFAALAYGTTEASSIGADPVSTTWAAAYVSKWGCAQASGNLWVWGANFGGGAAAAGWVVNTVGRGSTYQMENAAIFGGSWGVSSNSGSRCSYWNFSPTISDSNIGARGVCDLLILE